MRSSDLAARGHAASKWVSRCLVVLLAAWGIVACGGHPPAPPPSSPVAERDVAALTRRANEAFAAMQRPDYRRPFVEGPDIPLRVSVLYFEACRAGDKRSCWMANEIGHSDRTELMVRRNCLNGDLMSCRALPEDRGEDPDKRFPGWAGRAVLCDTPECHGALRQECTAGYPESCWALGSGELDDGGAFHERATALADQGCRAGIANECRWLERNGIDYPEREIARERLCRLTREKCHHFYRHDDPIKARDLLEHGCQYGYDRDQEISCGLAESRYHEKKIPEPYPGRARALAIWSCQRMFPGSAKCVQNPWFFQRRPSAP